MPLSVPTRSCYIAAIELEECEPQVLPNEAFVKVNIRNTQLKSRVYYVADTIYQYISLDSITERGCLRTFPK